MTTYNVNYSDPARGSIVVNAGTVDYSTSVGLVGYKSYDYGTVIAEGFLHLLENFASPTPPPNPTQGQLWYKIDSANSVKTMLVYDGVEWVPTNGVYQTPYSPTSASLGDLWVDVSTQQLKIFDGNTWIVPTPGYNFSEQTGVYPETVKGINGQDYFIIKNYLGGEVVSILSNSTFTPLISISGFSELSPGINLSSKTFNGTSVKFNGIASEAAALRVTLPSVEVVQSNNFFRKDVQQSLTFPVMINNDSGVRVGTGASAFVFEKIDNNGVITNTKDSSKIIFRIEKNGNRNTILTVDGDQKRILVSGDTVVEGGITVSGEVTSLNSTRTGTVELWAGTATSVPDGWLRCNGASYSKTGDYARLFGVIGTQYGTDSETTFRVPNIASVTPVTGPSIYYIIKT